MAHLLAREALRSILTFPARITLRAARACRALDMRVVLAEIGLILEHGTDLRFEVGLQNKEMKIGLQTTGRQLARQLVQQSTPKAVQV